MAFARKDFDERQRQWAIREGLQVSDDYFASYRDNLFEQLSSQALIDYGDGKGSELTGNMCSLLRSSSALAANLFHYWSRANRIVREPLYNALGAPCVDCDIRFEYQTENYPLKKYLPNTPPPNIDVLLRCGNNAGSGKPSAFGIESKLQELFDSKTMVFGVTYTREPFWDNCGLMNCQRLVHKIMADIKVKKATFKHLGADQLLKHALGLATEFPGRFTLLYLCYEFADEPAAQDHRDEINQFKMEIDGEFDFRVMTYQKLYANLLTECNNLNCISQHKTYLDNLAQRYF